MKLIEIASEFKALYDIIENDVEYNEETGEVINNDDLIKEMFNGAVMQLSDKLDNAAYVIASLSADAEFLKNEAKRLSDRANNYIKNAEKLKELMTYALESSGEDKIKAQYHTFSFRKIESIFIPDTLTPEDMPRQFVRIKREFDKTAIKNALKNGEEILDGIVLKTNKNLQIK